MIEHLSKNELSALSDLAVIGHSMAVPLMLVGANARRLTFDIPLHLTSPRTTQDWDFAAPMEHWEIFVRFYGQTVGSEGARFRAGDSAHRIIHKETGILLDLVPFGPLSDLDGNIRWPQSNEVMSVLGFQEAYESCIHEKLPNGVEIGFVTPALLAALKIVAFLDRGNRTARDLPDLWFIMSHYAHGADDTDRFFEIADKFPDEGYYEHPDSLLLGWDIGRQCRVATLAAIERALRELSSAESQRLDPLISRTADLEEQQAQRQRIAAEFAWLQRGIDLAETSH